MVLRQGATNFGSVQELPAVMSVEEAARLLRIGRSAAYEQARIYRATGGREGLPVIVFGRSLRVPTGALLELLATCTRARDAS